MSWETLDDIADSVNPILGVIALIWPWLRWRHCLHAAALNVLGTLLSVALTYALSALDAKFGWWPAVGLDFSTHTAIAVALVISLSAIKPSLWMAWAGVLLGYFALMIHQGYHTIADILTTTTVVAPPLILGQWWVRPRLESA